MSKKIEDLKQSIKSGLSFDDYTPSTHNNIKPDAGNDVIKVKHNAIKKVKRTFYIREEVADQLDALYAKYITEKKKVDKSDIVTQALINLLENSECEVKSF